MRLSVPYSIIANRYRFALSPPPLPPPNGNKSFFRNWETLFYFSIRVRRATRPPAFNANPRDIETGLGEHPLATQYPPPRPFYLAREIRCSRLPATVQFFLGAYSRPFPPLLLRPSSSPSAFLPPSENPYTLLAGSSDRAQRGARRVVCSLFRENRRFLVSPPVHPSAVSFAGPSPDVLPLSSRKKFFYNFRIVPFRPSPFFYLPCRSFSSRIVGFSFHYQPSSSFGLPHPSMFSPRLLSVQIAHVVSCFLIFVIPAAFPFFFSANFGVGRTEF